MEKGVEEESRLQESLSIQDYYFLLFALADSTWLHEHHP
jgi:hypothetical protein